jgi:hypothetical protein
VVKLASRAQASVASLSGRIKVAAHWADYCALNRRKNKGLFHAQKRPTQDSIGTMKNQRLFISVNKSALELV